MKSFTQTYTDFQSITNDASTSSLALAKTYINNCVHKILSLSDWNFNKSYKDYTTAASQKEFEKPYNAAKVSDVYVYTGGVWYVPKEIKTDALWKKINYVAITSDVPSYWFVNNETGNIELYPTHNTAGDTVRVKFTKRIRDMSVADYITGTLTTVVNDQTILGAGTTWVDKMEGSWLKITSTVEPIGDMWFEIESITDTTHLEIKENMPVAVAGASYVIAEMIPFMDGFEDIALWYSLDKYYQMREKPTLAREYERMWKEALEELFARDQKSADGVLEKEIPLDIKDPNKDPWAIEIV